jgi:hypothetical protein
MTNWRDDLERARAEAQRAREEAHRLRDEAHDMARRVRHEARQQAWAERGAQRSSFRRDWSPGGDAGSEDGGVKAERELDLDGIRDLQFEQTAGRVVVRGCTEGETPGVVTSGTNAAPQLDVRKDGERLVITVRMASGWLFRRRQGARTEVRIAGTIDAIRINAGYGDLQVRDISFGRMRLEAGAGTISCSGTLGSIEASMGAGRIALREHKGTARCNTGTGDIYMEIAEVAEGDYVANSGIGRAELRLPPGQQVEIKASSGIGRARVDYPSAGSDARAHARVEAGVGEAVVRALEHASSPDVEPGPAPKRPTSGPSSRRREAEELRVLQMLEQGRITAQEAADLIAALHGAAMPGDDVEPAAEETKGPADQA